MPEYRSYASLRIKDGENYPLITLGEKLRAAFGLKTARTFRGTIQFPWTDMGNGTLFDFKHPHPVEVHFSFGQGIPTIEVVSLVYVPAAGGNWRSDLLSLAPVRSGSELVVINDPTVQQMLDMVDEPLVTNQDINLWGGQHGDQHALFLHQDGSRVELRPVTYGTGHDTIEVQPDDVVSDLVAQWLLNHSFFWPEHPKSRMRLNTDINNMVLWRMRNDPRWQEPLAE
jgi:hypothetical protein